MKKTIKKNNIFSKLKTKLNKQNIIYLLIICIDIFLVIYTASKNTINYVSIDNDKPIYLGNKTNLFLGRNYVNLLTSIIVYIYLILLNKLYFKKKLNIKILLILLISILIINCILFYLFINKVY